MTNDELNQLFASAREIPVETAPEQIAGWVGAAAASSSGLLGIVAKLKLFIAKKSIIMLGISLGTVGAITVSSVLLMGAPSVEKEKTPPAKKEHVATVLPEEETQQDVIELPAETEEVRTPKLEESTETPVAEEWIPAEPMTVLQTHVITPRIQGIAESMALHITEISGQKEEEEPKAKKKKKKRGAVKGNGEVTKEERTVQPFTEIAISGVFDVILTQGSTEKVEVETDSNLQEFVVVENDGNKLLLRNEKVKIKKSTKMKVYVTVKDLSMIRNTGVGDVIGKSSFKFNKLELDFSNVGDASLDVECEELFVEYNGVGDVTLKGSAKTSAINSSGVGNVKAYELEVGTMVIKHTGVGDANINVSESLILDFQGVGNVYYKGNPKEKEITKSGVGSVKSKS